MIIEISGSAEGLIPLMEHAGDKFLCGGLAHASRDSHGTLKRVSLYRSFLCGFSDESESLDGVLYYELRDIRIRFFLRNYA